MLSTIDVSDTTPPTAPAGDGARGYRVAANIACACVCRQRAWYACTNALRLRAEGALGRRETQGQRSPQKSKLTWQQRREEHEVARAHNHQLVLPILCTEPGKGEGAPLGGLTGGTTSAPGGIPRRRASPVSHFSTRKPLIALAPPPHALPTPGSPLKARGSMFLMTETAPQPLPSSTTRVLVAAAAGGGRAAVSLGASTTTSSLLPPLLPLSRKGGGSARQVARRPACKARRGGSGSGTGGAARRGPRRAGDSAGMAAGCSVSMAGL